MKQKLIDKLYKEFPKVYPKPVPADISCGDGWYPIIYDLSYQLNNCELPKGFYVFQIKEKFGGLRFYPSCSNEEINNLIQKAEWAAEKTCEDCGKPGELRQDGWLTTLCDEHVD